MAEEKRQEFGSWESETVGFKSNWKDIKKEYSSTQIQTDEIKVNEKPVQCVTQSSHSVQTEDEFKVSEVREMKQPYPPSLYAFFSKVTDEMCRCLEENLDPFAVEVFKDCGEDETGDAKGGKEKADNTNTAKKEFTLRDSEIPDEVGGSCIAWNKSGNQVAVGYTYLNHTGFCSHRLPVSMWNLSRSLNFNANQPHSQIFLPDCATTIEFHPAHPSIAAVGLWSGHIAIVDFSSSDLLSHKSDASAEDTTFDDMIMTHQQTNAAGIAAKMMANLGYFIERSGHRLAISSVQWLKLNPSESSKLFSKNKMPSQCGLLTAGKDGLICLWSTNASNTRLVLEKKFIIWTDCIPQDIPLGNHRYHHSPATKALAILRLSSCANDPFAFVVVTVAGLMFQGNLDSNIEAYSAMAELSTPGSTPETIYDPGVVYLWQTFGYPNSIECSPFHRNIFLEASADGRVCVHNMLDAANALVEIWVERETSDALADAKWSTRPAMFAVARDNFVQFYDLTLRNSMALALPHENIVTRIAFNRAQKGTIASCDTKGTIHVWHLPSALISHELNEMDILLNLGKVSA